MELALPILVQRRYRGRAYNDVAGQSIALFRRFKESTMGGRRSLLLRVILEIPLCSPGTNLQKRFMLMLHVQDYHWEYRAKNRFSYFGNGFSWREIDSSDNTWYIDRV